MGLPAINVSIELATINCGMCGGTYAINERYRALKAEQRGTWNCPYCGAGWGYKKGENDRLREQIEEERRRTLAALARENEERAEKERLKRQLKRVDRGVCPQCNRSFTNLARHMACKHKESK